MNGHRSKRALQTQFATKPTINRMNKRFGKRARARDEKNAENSQINK